MLRTHRALGVVLVLIPAVGCQRYETRLPETGATLEGEITYGGQKLPLALVTVFGEKGQAIGQAEEGRYKVENVPLGEVKIGVNTEAMRSQIISQQMASSYKGPGAKGGGAKSPAPRFVEVPAKYWDPETSGITTTIKHGTNSFNVTIAK